MTGNGLSIANRNRPDDFAEVVEMFLEEADEVAGRLRGAAPTDVEAELHFLKGSALNLGFASLQPSVQARARRRRWGASRSIGRSGGDLPRRRALLEAGRCATSRLPEPSDQEFGQRLVRGDVAVGKTRRIHPVDKLAKARRPPSFRSRSGPNRSCAPISSGIRNGRCRRPDPAGLRNSRKAPGRCGIRRMKYFFRPA